VQKLEALVLFRSNVNRCRDFLASHDYRAPLLHACT
jgi:hypothetical protein